MSAIENIRPRPVRMRGVKNLVEDLRLLAEGILDSRSLVEGYRKVTDPVEIVHRDGKGKIKGIRRTHNLRTADGSNNHASLMSAFPFLMQSGQGTIQNVPGFAQYSPSTNVAITAPTSSTAGKVTDTNAGITSSTAALNQMLGFTLLYGTAANQPRMAHIVGNSVSSASSVIWYFDQWFSPADPSATVAAPAANLDYIIIPGGPSYYMALSTDGTAPAVLDHIMAGELAGTGANAGLGRTFCTIANATHAIATGSTGSFSYKNTFTLTGAGPVNTIQKCGMFTGYVFPNDAASDLANVGKGGGVMVFENTFASVNMATNDTLTVTWTVNF